jgi:hypothetical protein
MNWKPPADPLRGGLRQLPRRLTPFRGFFFTTNGLPTATPTPVGHLQPTPPDIPRERHSLPGGLRSLVGLVEGGHPRADRRRARFRPPLAALDGLAAPAPPDPRGDRHVRGRTHNSGAPGDTKVTPRAVHDENRYEPPYQTTHHPQRSMLPSSTRSLIFDAMCVIAVLFPVVLAAYLVDLSHR